MLRLFTSSASRKAEVEQSNETIKTNSAHPKSWGAQMDSTRPVRPRRAKDSAIIQTMKAIQRKEEEAAKRKETSQETIDPAFIKRFEAGSTYDPFDFSLAKLRLDQKLRANATRVDRFKATDINPLDLWKDPVGLSNFLSASGNIMGSHVTGNNRKNQKLLSKAIKRAQRAGLLSKHHKSVDFLSNDTY